MPTRKGCVQLLVQEVRSDLPAVRLPVEILKAEIPPLLRRDEVMGDAMPSRARRNYFYLKYLTSKRFIHTLHPQEK